MASGMLGVRDELAPLPTPSVLDTWGAVGSVSDPCDPVTPWARVTCVSGQVAALDLSFLAMATTLPRALLHLTSLTSFKAVSSSFVGALPPEWVAAWGAWGDRDPCLRWRCLMLLKIVLCIRHQRFFLFVARRWGAGLSSLQVLQLDTNTLNGVLPVEWSSLTTLTTISLASNSLSGTIPAP